VDDLGVDGSPDTLTANAGGSLFVQHADGLESGELSAVAGTRCSNFLDLVEEIDRSSALAAASFSSALELELVVDEPTDLQVSVTLHTHTVAVARAFDDPEDPAATKPAPLPHPVASASFAFGVPGAPLLQRSVTGDQDAEVAETVPLEAGVTYVFSAQIAATAAFVDCGPQPTVFDKEGVPQRTFSLTSPPAPADESAWINPAGGAHGTAENWDPATVPTATDRARFELASVFAVQLGGARTLQARWCGPACST
jgi:hypothetical protein